MDETTVITTLPSEVIVEEPTREALIARVDALTQQVETLRAQISHQREIAETTRSHHISDITLIGERLIEEANDRGWCNEFDEIVAQLNRRLNYPLPVRSRKYLVWFRVGVIVEAESDDDAGDNAENAVDFGQFYDYEVTDVEEYDD